MADRQFDLVSTRDERESSSEPKSEVRLRAEAAMARKLVVCCDGTWNTPRKNTNIYRTYTFLRDHLVTPREVAQKDGVTVCSGKARDGTEVMLFYDRGVGTNWFTHLLGGGVGAGLSDNVRDAYLFLAQNFTPGAEIYIFGFSRGVHRAFAVRIHQGRRASRSTERSGRGTSLRGLLHHRGSSVCHS